MRDVSAAWQCNQTTIYELRFYMGRRWSASTTHACNEGQDEADEEEVESILTLI